MKSSRVSTTPTVRFSPRNLLTNRAILESESEEEEKRNEDMSGHIDEQ